MSPPILNIASYRFVPLADLPALRERLWQRADSLGLKGFSVGGASVSTKHANFVVVEEGARAQHVYDLVWAIRRRVGADLGLWLRPEVRFAGPFRPSPDEAYR